MRVTVTARTSKVGSEVSKEIVVDDGDLEGLSKEERDEVISEAAQQTLVCSLIEWDWQEA